MKVKGDLAAPKEAPILVFAPHSTFYDVLVWCWCCTFTEPFISPPYVVSRAENKKIPLFGNIFELVRSLDVSREDPNSRKNTLTIGRMLSHPDFEIKSYRTITYFN